MTQKIEIEDPFLSPKAMSDDGGISMSTWRRRYREKLAAAGVLVRLSPRRIGTRQSNWRQVLEQNTERSA
jgi:hypothetical protein